ncbi:type IX secretion system sortase PorU [Cruoricaptor ignavus]|uniref:type IX secretion system sortase PorU n=1 Tax=Cruoricaptor ignavus TaxID=1118202 RepID=UPI00370D7084
MRKRPISILLLALGSSLAAQKVEIQWGEPRIADFGSTKRTYPDFKNEGYDSDGINVYLNYKAAVENPVVQNPVWEKTEEVYDLRIEESGDAPAGIYPYTTFAAAGSAKTIIRIPTYKFENGQAFRLKSFVINKDESKSANSETAKRLGTGRAKVDYGNPFASQNTFYKIRVDKSGVFKITKKFLQEMGINTNSVNPKNLHIYGNGGAMLPEYNADFQYPALQEAAIQVVGEDDGKWDDGDYALFYAQGPDAFNLYRNSSNQSPAARTETRFDASRHIKNIYEDAAYYFISFDGIPGKRIPEVQSPAGGENITRYDDYQFINNDKLNLMRLGRVWVEEAVRNEKKISFKLRTPLRQEDAVYYRTSYVGYKSQGNSITTTINNSAKYTQRVANQSGSDFSKMLKTGTLSSPGSSTLEFSAVPNISGNPNGVFYFDYAEVMYPQDLNFNGSQMNFRKYSIDQYPGSTYTFSFTENSGLEQVWDVSDNVNPVRKLNAAGSGNFRFGHTVRDDFQNEFVAFKAGAAYLPKFVGKVQYGGGKDLMSLTNIDYLIITGKNFLSEANRLKSYHENSSKFNVAVADVEQIYNEFGSGSRDITAIRNFVTRLHRQTGNLKYVLILGDTSYDFKNRIQGNDNIVSSYQSEYSGDFISSYVTDDYFVMTRENSSMGSNVPDLPIGRLPAASLSEAKVLVDKTLAYYNALPGQSSPFGDWRMKLDFVVDDDNDDRIGNTDGQPFNPILNGNFHDVMDFVIKNNFEKDRRTEYNIRKLYLDAFPAESSAGGQRYPLVNQAISSDINNSLYLFYFGHGGINGWAQERVLTLDEIKAFNNFNPAFTHLPLVSTITCEFTLWDDPDMKSAGEQLMKLRTGGAATMITSSRAVGVSYGRRFTNTFTNHIFEQNSQNEFRTLGEAHLAAKKEHGYDSNHLKVNFLGDPAMRLSRPKENIVIEEIHTPTGVLRALDKVVVKGFIKNDDGTLNQGFNGRVVVNIYDKKTEKTTRNNDGDLTPVLKYSEESSALVKASGKVESGRFEVDFYIPKDIDYNIGDGRILVYADNFETTKSQAFDVFASKPVKVGQINENSEIINDTEAPKIQLYLNNTNFADGGIANENPVVLACLSDNSGINSTGAGIGHDITLILDGEVVNTQVLNDFYAPGDGNGCTNPGNLADFQRGSVSYPLRNLRPGDHQLTMKVWDINNNSSTASLNFVVRDSKDEGLAINRLLNWPNPFTDKTYFQFEHNCDSVLEASVQIYTITGKLVRSLRQHVSSERFLQGYRTPRQAIMWDGRDDHGSAVGRGTYIYKVNVKSPDQEKCRGSATAVEKLVILK